MEYILLGLIITLSLITDTRYRKIPNELIVLGIFMGLGYQIYTYGVMGIVYSLVGLICGIALLLIPFALGGMEAGDVKLLGVIGAIKGGQFAFYTFLYSAIWGGLIALILLIYHRKIISILRWFKSLFGQLFLKIFTKGVHSMAVEALPATGLSIPYAIPIFVGTITILAFEVIPW